MSAYQFVPKRFGLGWTVNLGHPRGRMILIGSLVLIGVIVILGALASGFTAPYGCHPPGCSPFP